MSYYKVHQILLNRFNIKNDTIIQDLRFTTLVKIYRSLPVIARRVVPDQFGKGHKPITINEAYCGYFRKKLN